MTTLRKRLSASILAALVLLALLLLAMLPPRPGVTKANFDRIQEGMTEADVESIFGAQPRRGSEILAGGGVMCITGVDGSRANLMFVDGVVESKFWTPSTETVLDKIRRWLRR